MAAGSELRAAEEKLADARVVDVLAGMTAAPQRIRVHAIFECDRLFLSQLDGSLQ